jgi:hypothetical protein
MIRTGLAIAAIVACITGAGAGDLPNPHLTTGAVDPSLTKVRLCASTFRTSRFRNVSIADKRKVYAAYRMHAKAPPCKCEVDHLIPIEIGGSNNAANLWPQSYNTKPWNAHVKDTLENKLHHLVCSNHMSLPDAQRCIVTDWITCWHRINAQARKP